jgi:hypothetical protein
LRYGQFLGEEFEANTGEKHRPGIPMSITAMKKAKSMSTKRKTRVWKIYIRMKIATTQ